MIDRLYELQSILLLPYFFSMSIISTFESIIEGAFAEKVSESPLE